MLAPQLYNDALKAEEVRLLCYQVAAEVHLARVAVQAIDDFARDTTLLALNRQFHRWEEVLNGLAGGPTFDRLNKLEEASHEVA